MSDRLLEEAGKLLELIQKVREISGGKFLLRVCVNIAVISFLVLLLVQNSFLSAMLKDMSETIKALSFLALLLCVVSIPTITLTSWIFRKYDELLDIKQQELDAKKQEIEAIRERERIKGEINGMSEAERKIFNLVEAGKGCGVWVACKNAAVQTLLCRGLIERLGDIETWQDWESGFNGSERCMLVKIPERIEVAMA